MEEKKSKTKKLKSIIIGIVCVVILIFIAIVFSESIVVENPGDFPIITREKKFCITTKPKKYYEIQDVTVYLSCLSNVYVKDENKKVELKEYLKGTKEEFDEKINKITSMLNIDYNLLPYDGGTKIYVDDKEDKKTNNGITFVVCHTLDGDNDIYIGPKGNDLSDYCH